MKHVMFCCRVALFSMLAACSGKKEAHIDAAADTASARDEWKEMDDFHMVMAESFHPYKDSSDLQPAKAKAPELAAAAARWANGELPERVKDDAAVSENLDKLKHGTASFAETVKGGDDKAIADSLTALHDLFHHIQEQWYGGEGHHH